MKRLIICNTYSQLILAFQLKLTLFANDEVDLWISDNSTNSEEVFLRVKSTKLFNKIKFLELKSFFYGRSVLKSLEDIWTYNFGAIKNAEKYDEIIFYNFTLSIYALSDYYYKIGHNCQWSRFEEGIFSYNTDFPKSIRLKVTGLFRLFIKRPDVLNLVTRFYCVYPWLKNTHLNWELVKIPDFFETKNKLLFYLNYVFDYHSNIKMPKYIYFASSSDVDNKPFGETSTVIKLANFLGKENFIVKMHPRDNRTIYQDLGINVLDKSFIPWEIIQLNMDITKHCLLTVNSGAFITISAMLKSQVSGYFLYNMLVSTSQSFISRKYEIHEMLSKLHAKGICLTINDNLDSIYGLCMKQQL